MPSGPMLWAHAVLAVTLVIAAVTDVRSGKIYNVVTYPAIAVGLIGHTVLGGLMGDAGSPLGLSGSAAGFAVGYWEDKGQLEDHWAEDRRWEPSMNEDTKERGYHYWKKAVRRTFDWLEQE